MSEEIEARVAFLERVLTGLQVHDPKCKGEVVDTTTRPISPDAPPLGVTNRVVRECSCWLKERYNEAGDWIANE